MTGIDSQLPPGFRFHPTDEELVVHYLCRKCASQSFAVPIIAEIDLYKYAPWDLPDLALYGEKEWYFFSRRERKYPNGSRPNRAAGNGYWKATGVDKPIGHPIVGIKKALVFYSGKAPKGEKTNWIMHEYRLAQVDRSPRSNINSSNVTLDEWVLCRIYKKKDAIGKQEHLTCRTMMEEEDIKPVNLTPMPQPSTATYGDFLYLDAQDSVPLMQTDPAKSERVVPPEIESDRKVIEWEKGAFSFPFNYMDAAEAMGGNEFYGSFGVEPISTVFGYI